MTTHEVQAIGPRKIIVQLTRAVTYLIYFYLIAVEIILILGFFLLLFGANSSASFTQWAYRNLDRVMEPFRGIFAPIELGTTSADVQAVFDTAVLFAMIVYGIIAIVMSWLITWLTGRLRYLEAAEADAEYRQEQDRLAAAARAPGMPPTATTYPQAPGVQPTARPTYPDASAPPF